MCDVCICNNNRINRCYKHTSLRNRISPFRRGWHTDSAFSLRTSGALVPQRRASRVPSWPTIGHPAPTPTSQPFSLPFSVQICCKLGDQNESHSSYEVSSSFLKMFTCLNQKSQTPRFIFGGKQCNARTETAGVGTCLSFRLDFWSYDASPRTSRNCQCIYRIPLVLALSCHCGSLQY